jgi:hypothetical protein
VLDFVLNGTTRCRKIVSDKPAPLPDIYSTELRFLILKLLEKVRAAAVAIAVN